VTLGIPKRIIQTGKSRDLPLLARAAVTNLRLLNPDYEYMFFDDRQVEEFVDAEFPDFRSVMDSFPRRIQRFDLFRYLAFAISSSSAACSRSNT
jgi:mannosyltransferase OCH1-like enzyme